jgi:NADH-quinone oxidoreductase subunit F
MMEFQNWQAAISAVSDPNRPFITVCGGTGCRVYGSEKVWEAFRTELIRRGANATLDYEVKVTGCHGFCERGPLVVIRPQGIFYSHVTVGDVPEIVSETILGDRIVERLLYVDPLSGNKIEHEDDVPFCFQQRLILTGMAISIGAD